MGFPGLAGSQLVAAESPRSNIRIGKVEWENGAGAREEAFPPMIIPAGRTMIAPITRAVGSSQILLRA